MKSERHPELTSLALHLAEAAKYPNLNPQEEAALAPLCAAGDHDARTKLLNHSLRFAANAAKKYWHLGVPFEDLIAAANIGLWKATGRPWDPTRANFRTYAFPWVRAEIHRTLNALGFSLTMGLRDKAKARQVQRQWAVFNRTHGHAPTMEELAELVGMDRDEVEVLQLACVPAASLNKTNGNKGESTGDERTLGDRLASDTPATDALLEARQQSRLIEQALAALDPRREMAVRMYLGLPDYQPHALQGIADVMGISRERVRQYLVGAYQTLRKGPLALALAQCHGLDTLAELDRPEAAEPAPLDPDVARYREERAARLRRTQEAA